MVSVLTDGSPAGSRQPMGCPPAAPFDASRKLGGPKPRDYTSELGVFDVIDGVVTRRTHSDDAHCGALRRRVRPTGGRIGRHQLEETVEIDGLRHAIDGSGFARNGAGVMKR